LLDVSMGSARRVISMSPEHVVVEVGELDQQEFLAAAEALDELIPDSTQLFIPGAGHVANLDRPLKVTLSILSFLSTHDTAPGVALIRLTACPARGLRAWRDAVRSGARPSGRARAICPHRRTQPPAPPPVDG
jgi:hypothetical protein